MIVLEILSKETHLLLLNDDDNKRWKDFLKRLQNVFNTVNVLRYQKFKINEKSAMSVISCNSWWTAKNHLVRFLSCSQHRCILWKDILHRFAAIVLGCLSVTTGCPVKNFMQNQKVCPSLESYLRFATEQCDFCWCALKFAFLIMLHCYIPIAIQ